MHSPTTPHLDPIAPVAVWAGLIATLLVFSLFAAAALVGVARTKEPTEPLPAVSSAGAIPTNAPPLT